jgi:Tol biopolymer transport system component
MIVFNTTSNELRMIKPDGTGERGVPIEDAQDPAWSPDGKKLAFVCLKSALEIPNLCVGNADGTEVIEIAQIAGSPTWSRDGRMILFDRSCRVYAAKPDGSGVAAIGPAPVSTICDSSPSSGG